MRRGAGHCIRVRAVSVAVDVLGPNPDARTRDFGHVLEGTDIIAFNHDGAIQTVVSFFGSTTCR